MNTLSTKKKLATGAIALALPLSAIAITPASAQTENAPQATVSTSTQEADNTIDIQIAAQGDARNGVLFELVANGETIDSAETNKAGIVKFTVDSAQPGLNDITVLADGEEVLLSGTTCSADGGTAALTEEQQMQAGQNLINAVGTAVADNVTSPDNAFGNLPNATGVTPGAKPSATGDDTSAPITTDTEGEATTPSEGDNATTPGTEADVTASPASYGLTSGNSDGATVRATNVQMDFVGGLVNMFMDGIPGVDAIRDFVAPVAGFVKPIWPMIKGLAKPALSAALASVGVPFLTDPIIGIVENVLGLGPMPPEVKDGKLPTAPNTGGTSGSNTGGTTTPGGTTGGDNIDNTPGGVIVDAINNAQVNGQLLPVRDLDVDESDDEFSFSVETGSSVRCITDVEAVEVTEVSSPTTQSSSPVQASQSQVATQAPVVAQPAPLLAPAPVTAQPVEGPKVNTGGNADNIISKVAAVFA